MEIQAYNVKGTFYPVGFPQEIKTDGRLEYFLRGEGYKKTKVFTLETLSLPNTLDDARDIKQAYDKYGAIVAKTLITNAAEAWQCGVLSLAINHTDWLANLQSLNTLLNIDNPCELFKLCGFGILFGFPNFSPVELDKYLRSQNLDFEPIECTYKGKTISTRDYVNMKYGIEAVALIEKLINSTS